MLRKINKKLKFETRKLYRIIIKPHQNIPQLRSPQNLAQRNPTIVGSLLDIISVLRAQPLRRVQNKHKPEALCFLRLVHKKKQEREIFIQSTQKTVISRQISTIRNREKLTVPLPIPDTFVCKRCLVSPNNFRASARVFASKASPFCDSRNSQSQPNKEEENARKRKYHRS